MDADRFDAAVRALSTPPSRRQLLRGLALALGPVASGLPMAVRAKKPKPNPYGCLNVGKSCGGKDGKCCSDRCHGKNGKKTCVAHDTGGCKPGKSGCVFPPLGCTTSTGNAGACFTTTGKAGYCRANKGGYCTDCLKDKDCQGVLGSRASCVVCTSCPGGTMCGSPDPI